MRLSVLTTSLLLVDILSSVTGRPKDSVAQLICRDVVKPCGDGWSRIDEKRCAKYFTTPKAFKDADAHCKASGSELVSAHNDDQLRRVVCITILADSERKPFWIGAKRSGEGFVYTDGSKVDYSQWFPGQPDNFSGQEDCVEVNHKKWGLWNDDDCSDEINFMCAKNM
ncbi:C-type isolectin Sp-CL4-like [Pungitius pungitius]|uniref:C-type isolectin Sp-CL4-like n=1 Tax=Pungitius pungitius TaxID=134920 RepID=UPI00188769B1|nr:C-type isolectin Sp-CL4-like [Pungitius pungitius]